jgi:hypothetical protein
VRGYLTAPVGRVTARRLGRLIIVEDFSDNCRKLSAIKSWASVGDL